MFNNAAFSLKTSGSKWNLDNEHPQGTKLKREFQNCIYFDSFSGVCLFC